MSCKLCMKTYGQEMERPEDFGSDPRCAFPYLRIKDQIFQSENWNCATVNACRSLLAVDAPMDSNYSTLYSGDNRCGTIILPNDEFLILGWYKARGRTNFAQVLDYDRIRFAMEQDFINAIGRLT